MSSIINFQLYWQLTLWLVLLLSTKSIKFVLLSIATTSRVFSILQKSKTLSPHCRISHSKYSSPFEMKEISIKKKWTISRKSMLAMLSSNRKLLWSEELSSENNEMRLKLSQTLRHLKQSEMKIQLLNNKIRLLSHEIAEKEAVIKYL